VTSFGVFKLMLCYSLTEFASVIILYGIDSNLTSLQFLFIDIFLILNFASFFGKTGSFEKLHKHPPMTALLSFIPLTSITLFMAVTVATQVFSYYFIQSYDWFEPFIYDPNQKTFYTCYENYAVYSVSMFQYIVMAVVFSKGNPYRRPIYTNYYFTFTILLMIAICSYITLDPASWIIDALELQVPPHFNGRVSILVIAAVNFIICFAVEDLIVEYVLYRKVKPKFRNVDKSRQKYLKIERDLREDQAWPNSKSGDVSVNEMNEVYSNSGVVNEGFTKSSELTRF